VALVDCLVEVRQVVVDEMMQSSEAIMNTLSGRAGSAVRQAAIGGREETQATMVQ